MMVSGVEILVVKSARKTVSIFVERDGSVSARVPDNMTEGEIAAVLKSKEYQIHKNLAQWTQLNEKQVVREYVSGQSFLYLGRNYRLKIIDCKPDGLILQKGRFILSKSEHGKAKELFISFYKSKLREKLDPIVMNYQELVGVKPTKVKVMELRARWASCSSTGNINFHWKCAMAPIDVLNYIVLHELVHLIHHNHTSEFWNELDKVMPGYHRHIDWLQKNGAGMDL